MTILFPLLIQIIVLGSAWFFRNWIQAWATKGVEHRYNIKLEELRSSLRKSENELKDQIQRKEKELEVLRSPAMQTLVSQRNSLALKKIEALDLLWDCVHKMHPYKMAAEVMQRFQIDEICKKKELDEKTRAVFSTLYSFTKLDKLSATEPHRARLYISQTCWAKFAAYSAIGAYAAALLVMFKVGLTERNLLNQDSLKALVSVALPHQVSFLEQHGITASLSLMDELENSLLNDLRTELQGTNEVDDVERAKKIVDAANQLTAHTNKIAL